MGNPYANPFDVLINVTNLKKRAKSTAQLVDYLDLIMSGNRMPADVKTVLTNYVRSIDYISYPEKGLNRSLEALYMVMSSPYYLIQR
jgi:hypothetical protein